MSNASECIQKALEKTGMSCRELAERTNVPRATLHRYIVGVHPIPPAHLVVIAKALNLSPTRLLGSDADILDLLEEFLLVRAYLDAPARIRAKVDAILTPYFNASSV